MLTFTQYLDEGRDAPLYHGTQIYYAISILQDNEIKPLTTHMRHSPPGVSLTRSLRTALRWRSFNPPSHRKNVVFELDQRTIVQNLKIAPINTLFQWKGRQSNAKAEELFEEYVVGPIKPLSKYLLRVMVHPSITDSKYADSYDGINTLLNHPLLYDRINRKWMNK